MFRLFFFSLPPAFLPRACPGFPGIPPLCLSCVLFPCPSWLLLSFLPPAVHTSLLSPASLQQPVLLRFCLPALFPLSAASLPVHLVLLFWSFSPSSPAFASFFLSRSPPAFLAPLDSCIVPVRRMPNLRPESSVFLCVSEKIARSRDNFLTIWNSCNILVKSLPEWRRHKAKNRMRMI